ncbi:2OG-Fe(II) oxygenase [Polaromonas sp. YR568]|uniref:2OG-Fe(II) oxygenase n=1 Tax=Polaromonas sp. YR568 TaxID=1855301 RepID=UPI00398BC22C
MNQYFNLLAGDPAPWFKQRSFANPRYSLHAAAGRYLVLCFFGSAAEPLARAAIDMALKRRDIFNDSHCSFFGISLDPGDENEKRVADSYPGYRFLWDFDTQVSRLYGVLALNADANPQGDGIRRLWFVLDPTLRVLKVLPFGNGSEIPALLSYLANLPPPSRFAGIELQAPILMLPNVFPPEFCRRLVTLYDTHGGQESGFMREKDGKTILTHDHEHKRREDYTITQPEIVKWTQALIHRRIVPEIAKVHQFTATRMERYIIACYRADQEAHFRAHRDNTTRGTAHRRFAVSINLNDDFEGGEISFPEYGPRSFKPPPGAAVVFSCSLLHAVSTVTRGRRYAFLPFLYDDAAAKIREANNAFLDESLLANYKA